MQIYHYDADTGAFLGPGYADPDPLDEGNWLIPAHATQIEPPAYVEGNVRVFRNGAWGYVPEHAPEEEPQPDPQPDFKPIDPTPFWLAAFDLLKLKKSDIYARLVKADGKPDEDAIYIASLEIEGRKSYLRNSDWVNQLSLLEGIPSEQMDSLWLYAQEHYK